MQTTEAPEIGVIPVILSQTRLYTSSFFLAVKAPGRISIATREPAPYLGMPAYRDLCPGPWFKSVDRLEFRRRYYAQILSQRDPLAVIRDLRAIAFPHPPVLCCWERLQADDEWCHRRLVAEWLKDQIGIELREIAEWPPPREATQLEMF